MKLSEHDIGWLAGFLEGEGAFILTIASGYPIFKISVASTDPENIDKLLHLTGAGRTYTQAPRGLGKKTQYSWQLMRQNDVQRICNLIYPHMSPRRQAAIDKGLTERGIDDRPIQDIKDSREGA